LGRGEGCAARLGTGGAAGEPVGVDVEGGPRPVRADDEPAPVRAARAEDGEEVGREVGRDRKVARERGHLQAARALNP